MSLSLDTFATSFGAFVALVDYFPNIKTLQRRSFELEDDERPVPRLSRPLRGKLQVNHVRVGFSGFLNRFARLKTVRGTGGRYPLPLYVHRGKVCGVCFSNKPKDHQSSEVD